MMKKTHLAVVIAISTQSQFKKLSYFLKQTTFEKSTVIAYYFLINKNLYAQTAQLLNARSDCTLFKSQDHPDLSTFIDQEVAAQFVYFMQSGDFLDGELFNQFSKHTELDAIELILVGHIKIFKYGRLSATENNLSNSAVSNYYAAKSAGKPTTEALLSNFISSDYLIFNKAYLLAKMGPKQLPTQNLYATLNAKIYSFFKPELKVAVLPQQLFFLNWKLRLESFKALKALTAKLKPLDKLLLQNHAKSEINAYLHALIEHLTCSMEQLPLIELIMLKRFLKNEAADAETEPLTAAWLALGRSYSLRDKLELVIKKFVPAFLITAVQNHRMHKLNQKALHFYDQYYQSTIKKLQQAPKIRVVFLINKVESWSVTYLYKALKEDPRFEVKVLLLPYGHSFEAWRQKTKPFFEQEGIETELGFDPATDQYCDLKAENPQVVIYQQPWDMPESYLPEHVGKYALTIYVPYCFYMLDSEFNYYPWFHRYLWSYIVESPIYVDFYKKRYQATNCSGYGNPKIDSFFHLTQQQTTKPTIIYAPHHTLLKYPSAATFEWNGLAMLELARRTAHQFNWIFKPHPNFYEMVVSRMILTESEKIAYLKGWQELGTILNGGKYYQQFIDSALLITDSISFLAEYLPTGHPVIHLRSKYLTLPFSLLGKEIIKSYYAVHTLEELLNQFDDLMLKGHDPKQEARLNAQKLILNSNNEPIGSTIYKALKETLTANSPKSLL